MEAMFNFIPAPIALVLMALGFISLAVGAVRLGYKQYVKQWALELVTIAEDSIMGSGQGAKKKAQVFAALRGALPDWLKPFITDEVLDSVIEKAVSMMKKALAEKKPTINKE
nr:MAG TPA: holin [Caudoviricetes sp.]